MTKKEKQNDGGRERDSSVAWGGLRMTGKRKEQILNQVQDDGGGAQDDGGGAQDDGKLREKTGKYGNLRESTGDNGKRREDTGRDTGDNGRIYFKISENHG